MNIFALGEFHKIFTEPGWHWSGMYEAWTQLGHSSIVHDIRRESWDSIHAHLKTFEKTDLLFIGLKEGMKFILQYADTVNYLRKKGMKVVFWFADLRGVEGEITAIPMKSPVVDTKEAGKLLDVIFVSNYGQLEAYKKAYGIDKVFYLPAACSDRTHNRRLEVEDTHDIAFAGDMHPTVFHADRYKLLSKIKNSYNFIGGTWDRADISTFYSMAKLSFVCDAVGGHPDLHPYLYSSDRLFISGGCGSCMMVQKFPGLEKLIENHKHAVWFETEEELFHNIDYYLKEHDLRNLMRLNAYNLFHSKHSHKQRIINMLDIVEGKTEEFYGWL